MLILASTSDIIRVVTGSAASIAANASWGDNASGAITPGRTDTVAITTATTTTVVGSPGSSTQRTVEAMTLRNNHATATTAITVQHYDGTSSVDLTPTMMLQPGESLTLDDHGRWRHVLASGGLMPVDRTPLKRPLHGSWLAETYPREYMAEATSAFVSSAQAGVIAIMLKAGMIVNNISMYIGGSAANTPTHWQFGLYNSDGSLVCASADQTTTAAATNTLYTLAMVTPYVVQKTGVYYVGVTFTATSAPQFKMLSTATGGLKAAAMGSRPLVTAAGGLIDAGGGLATALALSTGSFNIPWAAVS